VQPQSNPSTVMQDGIVNCFYRSV